MKRSMWLLIVLALFVVNLIGCGGYRRGAILQHGNGIMHEDINASLLAFSIGPQELANAKATLIMAPAQAELYSALAKRIAAVDNVSRNGREERFLGVIINEDPVKTAFVDHPEMAWTYRIRPGNYEFIQLEVIPDRISVLFQGDKRKKHLRVYKIAKKYNGVDIQFGARIYHQ